MNLLDIFPAPKFLSPEVSGLSINDKFIRFVEFKKNPRETILKSFGEQEIEKGVIEGGEIKNFPAFVEVLSKFRKEQDLNFVRVALPEEKGFVFKTTLPRLNETDTLGALRFKIEENVPLPTNEAVFDFKEISESKNQREISVFVFPKKTATGFLEAMKQAGVTPTSFELESQACAYSTIKKTDNRSYLIIQADDHKTGFYIVENGVVQYTSGLNSDRTKGENSRKAEEAVPITHVTDGLKIYGAQGGDTSPLREEVEKLLDYWKSSIKESKRIIKKILVCGDQAAKKSTLATFQGLPIEVGLADVWTNAFPIEEKIPALNFKDSLGYAPAIGVALPLK